jgi:adenylosuccinate lyase
MDDLPRADPLAAVSPLDGRYADRTAPLVPYASEAALIRARTRVEVDYLLALADHPDVPVAVDDDERDRLESLVAEFDADDARLVKRIETEGTETYAATNHDVKAVEYLLREYTPERLHPWIHFGLTSEDVNNLARRLLVRGAVSEVLRPELAAVRDRLVDLAHDGRNLPMLARTHGQPATPTTFGKEMAVYASRLGTQVARVDRAVDGLTGKLAGASGTYAAHHVALPEVDWPAFAREFVASLGLAHEPLTTQVHHGDDLSALFDALRGANGVILDLDRDVWAYVSRRYLGQRSDEGETGSSTMPHKVNPIEFENSEGNLSKANGDLEFLGDYIVTSRLQRDLSDSTVKRNVGAAFAHCLVGYTKTASGLDTVVPNEAAMRADLADEPAVLAEAVQTVLRRAGHTDAYERVKAATRGREVSLDDLRDIVREADLPEDARDRLLALDPADYVGLAPHLARVDGDDPTEER